MPSERSQPHHTAESKSSRKRRAHNRSKRGCINCRLRRVKCDEKRPDCEKCQDSHITCSYASETTHLQSSHERAVTSVLTHLVSHNTVTLGLVNRARYDYHLDKPELGEPLVLNLEDLNVLLQFQKKTVRFIGSQWDMDIWDTEFIRLASLNPYLLHASITCAAMHGRSLRGQTYTKRTQFECYHWALSARLFNYEISQVSPAYDRDAVWMATVLMNWIVLYAIETQNPEKVWPLSPTISNIPWLPIQKGARTIWQLVRPDRADGLFSEPANKVDERCLGTPTHESGIDGIPADLVTLCGLDKLSTAENNPYFTAAHTLSTLLVNPSAQPLSLKFLRFINAIDPGFEAMLRQKDPRSLLLMSIWYGLVPKSAWWISHRAAIERRAICIYLDRYHDNDPLIREALAPF